MIIAHTFKRFSLKVFQTTSFSVFVCKVKVLYTKYTVLHPCVQLVDCDIELIRLAIDFCSSLGEKIRNINSIAQPILFEKKN